MSESESLALGPNAVNPYQASTVVQSTLADAPPVWTPPAPRPRIWPALIMPIPAFAAMIAANIGAVIGILIWHLANGGQPATLQDDLLDLLTRPDLFIVIGLASQVPLAAVALLAARLSPVPIWQRLALLRPAISWGKCAVLVIGGIVPFAVGIALAVALSLVLAPDETLAKLMDNMTPAMALPFVLFIALAPGFSEEMLFRGYIQSRLLQRWPAWAAILVTSTIFAVIHIQPHTVLFAFPIGIWLGIVAWQAKSIWPAIILHAAVNGSLNGYRVIGKFQEWPEDPPWPVLGGILAVGSIAFLWSLVMIAAGRQPTDIPASPAAAAP